MSGSSLAPAPSREEFIAERCRRSMRSFVPEAWPLVDSHAFKTNWHIDAICERLEAVSRGELRRLVINIPPRHMKSLAVAVFWPCWDWLDHPERNWLFVSYGDRLSIRDSVKCRRLIQSRGGRREDGTLLERVGYQGLLGLLGHDWQITSDQNAKTRFDNDKTGYRIATSIGGMATGEGGDIIVLDDPHKADEAESEADRDGVADWIHGTLPTRYNDPKTGALVVVMQRLHEEDATAHFLEMGGFEHLCLPAEYEPTHPFVWPHDPRTEPGELLWRDHFGPDELEQLKREMGSVYKIAGQLQQRPSPAEGGILKRAYWRYYDPEVLEIEDGWNGVHFTRLWQSWDTALKEKTTSDYTVGTLWGQFGSQTHLLREARGQWGLAETVTQIKAMRDWAKDLFPYLGQSIFVEQAANGPEVMAALRRGGVQGVQGVKVDRDKVSRAEAITYLLAGGNVMLPGYPNDDETGYADGTPPWVQALVEECASFPNGSHDDRVDSITQALDPRRWTDGRRRKTDRPTPSRITRGAKRGAF